MVDFGIPEGAVVRLRSGGPLLTVVGRSDRFPKTLLCSWFDGKKQIHTAEFTPASLDMFSGNYSDFTP
jgi:uncharacterized protein YodC (DUF2158 family)